MYAIGEWSGSAYIFNKNEANNPPSKPSTPSGPTWGITGVQHTYTTSATGPDGELVIITCLIGVMGLIVDGYAHITQEISVKQPRLGILGTDLL